MDRTHEQVVAAEPAGDGTAPDRGPAVAPAALSLPAWLGLAAGGVAGLVAGAGMFLVLGALGAGSRGFWYPLHAVQALMSGRRVLPESRGALRGASPTDVVVGPVLFLLPALVVGVGVAWWVGRRAGGSTGAVAWRTVVAAVVATLALFGLLVVVLGFREAADPVQRMSSGKGVRNVGLGAWIAAHAVYVAVLVAVFGPLQRAASTLHGRRTRDRRLPGDHE